MVTMQGLGQLYFSLSKALPIFGVFVEYLVRDVTSSKRVNVVAAWIIPVQSQPLSSHQRRRQRSRRCSCITLGPEDLVWSVIVSAPFSFVALLKKQLIKTVDHQITVLFPRSLLSFTSFTSFKSKAFFPSRISDPRFVLKSR